MARRHVGMAAVATAALTLSLLCGCGGATSSAPATDDAAATEETAEEVVEEVEEEPQLSVEDIAGYWQPDEMSQFVDKGWFGAYRFKKNGTVQILIYVYDSAYIRTGTYEIRDDKAYINIPEDADLGRITIQGQSYDVNSSEIKDAEVTVDGKEMTVDGVSKNGPYSLKKISKKKFLELKEISAAAGPKRVSVGDTITADGYTFTVNSLEFQDEIYPSDTSGYYRYYVHEDNSDYLVADITFTNDGTEYAVPGYSTGAQIKVGENKYSASVETDGGTNILKSYSTEAKDTSRIIIYASVPDAAREEGGDVSVTWLVPKNSSLLNTYFNSNDEHVMYVITK